MNDSDKTKTELVMENVHLRRKLAETEARTERMEKRYKGQLAHNEELELAVKTRNAELKERGERIKEMEGRVSLTDSERRILDMWPRFEDGEPVWFGDAIDRAGRKFTVMDVKLVGYDGEHCETFLYVESGDDVLEFSFDPGEPAYRPAPEVLDADGVPIEVGDTVYEAETGEEYKVDRVYDGTTEPDYPGHTVRCRRAGDCLVHVFKPCHLTHREPDSWDRLMRDATMNPFLYCAERGIETEGEDGAMKPTNEAFALDLVRRAKALAGIGVAR